MNVTEIRKEIIKNIKKYNTIMVQRHQNPDPDAYGSQMGLVNLLKNSFPKKHIYAVGSDDKGLDWIGVPDKTPDKTTQSTYKNALVIVTDCANAPRISGQNYQYAKKIIKIDHHPVDKAEAKEDAYASLNWVNPKASSASEMVFDLARNSKDLKMTDNVARCLYAGIIGDTGRFMFPNTSTHTLYDVMELSKYNFSMSEVNQDETKTTLNVSRLYGYLEEHLHAFKNGVAYYTLTQAMIKKYHITDNDFISKNIPGNIRGIVAWAMFKEQPDKTFKVSLRSHAPQINHLAEKYNGGGHALASGARVKDAKQAKELLTDLSQIVDDYKKNN